MASTQLNKSVQKNAGVDTINKMTFSAWVKRSALGEGIIFAAHQLSSYYTHFYFNSDDRIQIYSYINSSTAANLVLERRFRDTNAWYHIVLTIDTTLGTDSDRMKVYVNGERETVTNGGTTYPSQNSGFGQFNDTGATLNIGNTANRGAFSGVISHVHYIPYTAYDASAFGSTDSTTGEWKINTSPSVTYSTAGFFILKDGNSVTDQSGNSNNFTLGAGTLTKTEDSPSNVFATLNPLINTNQTLSNGNTVLDFPAGNDGRMYSTLAFSSGKFYAEFKINSFTADRGHSLVLYTDITTTGLYLSFCKTGNANTITSFGSTVQSGLASFSAGDIIGMAVDVDNGTVDFTRNGSAYGSQVTGLSSNFSGKDLLFGFLGEGHPTLTRVFNASANFGNGYFGTTAVSSAGTNASGNGIFEYDVPTGYTALSTKGLNE